ncbi:MAG: hypothetical protein WKF44_08985, partial [Rubrobacteraceae bacterium]
MGARRGTLIALGEGIYTVPEMARILQPTMTEDKLRYWLNEDLLGDPIRRGFRGRPHLLSFRQLLQARTIQHLRDALEFPQLFDETDGPEPRFIRTPEGEIGVFDGSRTYELVNRQEMISEAVIP